MYSVPSAKGRKLWFVPWEKWPKGGGGVSSGGGGSISLVARGLVGVVLGLEVVSVAAESMREMGGRLGGATKRSHMFLPIAHTSSQLRAVTSRPWVLQTQAMSQARRVMDSIKWEYASVSSAARVRTGLSM